MTAGKKSIIIFLVFSAACLLLLSVLAQYVFPQRVIKEKITRELSRLLQTDVAIDEVSFKLFFTPGITVQGISCRAAGNISLHIQKIILHPELQALFSGAFRIKRVTVRSPVVSFTLQKKSEFEAGGARRPFLAEVQRQASEVLAAVTRSMPSGSCSTEKGMVRLTSPDGGQLDFSSINLQVTTTQGRMALVAECASELWEKLELKADYVPRDSGGSAQNLSMALSIASVNVAACKKTAPAFVPPQHPLTIFSERIREGRIPVLSLNADIPFPCGEDWSRYISVQGRAEAMTLSLPEIGPEVHDLSGMLSLRDGMLEVQDVQARIENSRISKGILRLDSAAQFAPVLIQARVSADLADLPRLLHLIPSAGVRAELGLIKNPSGTADAMVTVRKESSGYGTEVAINGLKLNASYRSFPMPLAVQRGACICSGGILAFKDFSGSLGASVIPEISVSFGIREDDRFSASAREPALSLDDLAAVLSSFDATRAFTLPVTKASGSALVQDAAASGPLSSPREWAFSLRGSLSNTSFSLQGLAGPVSIPSAGISLDRSRISFSGVKLRFHDASLSGSLIFEDYFSGVPKAAGDVAGSLGDTSIARAIAYLNLPRELLLRGPLSLEKAKFTRQQAGAATFTADLLFPEKARASIDVQARPGDFQIRSLKIQDAQSQCSGSLGIRDDLFTVAYRGSLDKTTLDRVFADNRFVRGWIKGDFTAVFNQKNPLASSATGAVEWNNAGSAGFKRFPIAINSASITATGRDLRIDRAEITAGTSSAGIGGSVRFDERGFNLDLDASADSIDLDRDENILSRDNATSGGAGEEFWETPLRGTVKLTARELKKGPVTLSPFHVAIAFADRKVTATASDVQLCSVALPGSMQITPDGIILAVQPEAQGAQVKKVISCLTGEKSIITGTLDVQGELAGKGRASELGGTLSGPVTITCRKGRIYKSSLFTKILSFLSIRSLLSGGVSDITRKGFAYRLLEIHGEVRGNTFIVRDAILDSDPLALACRGSINLKDKTLDLTALATPFQIPDIGLKAVPFIGTLFSKKRIGVPIKISGNIEDAKLSPVLPDAIGKDLVGVVKKIVKLPVEIIDLPVLLFENKKEEKSKQ